MHKNIDFLRASNLHPEEHRQALEATQANILKGTGRHYQSFILFSVRPNKVETFKQWIKHFTPTSAWEQYQHSSERQEKGSEYKERIVKTMGLSGKGITLLNLTDAFSTHTSFSKGMRENNLKDSVPYTWEEGYKKIPDGIIALATNDRTELYKLKNDIEKELDTFCDSVFSERGEKLVNVVGGQSLTIEHFGYRDGISQPYFFQPQKEEKNQHWSDMAKPQLVLIDDPLSGGETGFGSFMVFRKLEQNVKAFKEKEHLLAQQLGFTEEMEELAGALIVGRSENGMPVLIHGSTANTEAPSIENNFNYSLDPEGIRCPFHSHIRKSNPRGDTERFFGTSAKEEQLHRIVRRGISYDDVGRNGNLEVYPEEGVGLLFICFQSSIENQFEFIQNNWVDNPDFPKTATGIDPLIGQGHIRRDEDGAAFEQKWTDVKNNSVCSGLSDFVTLKGGEYFYLPSTTFFKQK